MSTEGQVAVMPPGLADSSLSAMDPRATSHSIHQGKVLAEKMYELSQYAFLEHVTAGTFIHLLQLRLRQRARSLLGSPLLLQHPFGTFPIP